MDELVLIDANVFLRHFLQDDQKLSPLATSLIEKLQTGSVSLWLSVWVVAELVWVLGSVYKKQKGFITDAIQKALATSGVVVENRKMVIEALRLYSEKNVDFDDALIALEAKSAGVRYYCSFDKHFRRFPWLKETVLGA